MEDLIRKIIEFRDKRKWEKFHNIKDLLIGLNIEVGELQELFLWIDENEEKLDSSEIANELADIFIFVVFIAEKCQIDLETAIRKKLEIHKEHYPVKKSKGKNTKYTDIKDNE